MVSLRQLHQSLPPALLQSIEPGGARFHVAGLLGEIEQCWQVEGAAVQTAVAEERQQLIASGHALAKAILADKAALASRFVARTEAFLELAACAYAHGSLDEGAPIDVAIDEHRRHRVGSKRQLADYLRAGGPKQFAPESRLRDEALTWVEGLDGWLEPYIADPLAEPPLLTLGAPLGGSMLYVLTGFSQHGLWVAREAPWRRPARSAPDPPAWADRSLVIRSLEEAWVEALDHAPWIKQLQALHLTTARSGWLAAHLLELLFGDTWLGGDRAAALASGRDYERWKVAAGSSLEEWVDSGPLRGEEVLAPSGFDEWVWDTFYEFRNRGTKPFIDLALQVARVSVYAITTLARGDASAQAGEQGALHSDIHATKARIANSGRSGSEPAPTGARRPGAPQVPNGWMTVSEACAKYSLSSSTVHSWRRRGGPLGDEMAGHLAIVEEDALRALLKQKGRLLD